MALFPDSAVALAWGDLGQVLTFVGVPEEHWKAFEETVGDFGNQIPMVALMDAASVAEGVKNVTVTIGAGASTTQRPLKAPGLVPALGPDPSPLLRVGSTMTLSF